jgi:hypothetical protein
METQEKTIIPYKEQMETLIDMRLAGKLTKEEYAAIRTPLLKQISLLKERVKKPEPGVQDWRTIAEVAFKFSTHAHKVFQEGDTKTKRAMVMALGQNYTLKDRELSMEFNPLLQPMKIYAENNNK